MPPLRLPSAPIPRSSSAASNLPPLTVRAPKPLPSEPCLGEALRAAPRLVDDAFWLGLRYAADWEVRPHLRFALFAQGYLRLFVLPRPDERCVRCVVLTRRAAMAADVERRLAEAEMQQSEEAEEEEDALLALHEDPPFLGLLRACVMGPTAGSDWPASGAVAVEEERDGSGGFRLHRHQHASLAWMRAVEVEAGTTAVPLAAACPPLTVGGDDGLFSVDCHGAVWTRGAARHREEKQQAGKGDAVIDLPRGGLLAHPVGAGKTVIAASLLLPFPSSKLSEAATLILAPDHILFQWRRELARVLSDEGPSPRFVLVGFEELLLQQQAPLSLTEEAAGDGMEAIRARRWGRLVVDEGQLVPQDEALYEAVLGIQADVRWCVACVRALESVVRSAYLLLAPSLAPFRPLTPIKSSRVLSATPDHGLRWLMSLVYGRELSHDDFRRRRRAFVHTRTLRDAPGDCLPLPPLTSEMEAVTLSAEESQALALASALGESLGALRCQALVVGLWELVGMDKWE